MRFLRGFLLGYYIRGKKHLLVAMVASLTSIVVFCHSVARNRPLESSNMKLAAERSQTCNSLKGDNDVSLYRTGTLYNGRGNET